MNMNINVTEFEWIKSVKGIIICIIELKWQTNPVCFVKLLKKLKCFDGGGGGSNKGGGDSNPFGWSPSLYYLKELEGINFNPFIVKQNMVSL